MEGKRWYLIYNLLSVLCLWLFDLFCRRHKEKKNQEDPNLSNVMFLLQDHQREVQGSYNYNLILLLLIKSLSRDYVNFDGVGYDL